MKGFGEERKARKIWTAIQKWLAAHLPAAGPGQPASWTRQILSALPTAAQRDRPWRERLFCRRPPLLPEASQKLAALAASFNEQSAGMESCFLELGRALRGLHTAATELTSLVHDRAGSLRGALLHSRLGGRDGLAARSLQDLCSTLREISSLLQSLQAVRSALHHFQRQAHGIERIGVLLKISLVSFAVEGARSTQCQDAFAAFIGELRGLAERTGELGSSIGLEVQTTQRTQAESLNAMSSALETMRRLAQDLDRESQVTAAEAQELLDTSCALLQEAEDSARQVASYASEAVYCLQFGDIVRQKIEHIVASLRDAAHLLAQPATGEDGTAGRAAVDGVLAVQISQVELVRAEILSAHAKLETSFQGIGTETQRLLQVLQRNQGAGPGRGPTVDPLGVLRSDALSVEQLHRQGGKLGRQARQTARAAADASTRLIHHLDQVNAINCDLHLQALNAIVKTEALGKQGATLGVLSMEADRLYRDSNQVVEQITSIIQEIRTQAGVISGEESSRETPGDAAAPAESALHAALERISQAYEHFKLAAAEAQAMAQNQEALLQRSKTGLDFLPHLGGRLGQWKQELLGLRQELAVPVVAGAISSEMAAALGQRYTMQSEREIHQRILGDPSSPAPCAAEPFPGGEASLVANSVSSLPLAAPGLHSGATAGEGKAAPGVGPAPPAPDSLGDNVDLF